MVEKALLYPEEEGTKCLQFIGKFVEDYLVPHLT
jgi:hypothetical protein